MSLESFIPAIIADRDSDVPRLIAADWLEENGHPERGEFIRVQCELPADHEVNPQFKRLRRREQELFYKYGLKWFGWIPSTQDTRSWGVDYLGPSINSSDDWIYRVRRGFVNQVTITWEGWLKHAATILAMTPLETVEFTAFPTVHLIDDPWDRLIRFEFYDMPLWNREWAISYGEWRDRNVTGNILVNEQIQDKVLPSMWPSLTFILPRGNP